MIHVEDHAAHCLMARGIINNNICTTRARGGVMMMIYILGICTGTPCVGRVLALLAADD